MEALTTLAAALVLVVLALALPRLLAWTLLAVPLTTGDLRQAIESLATRVDVSVRDIFVWPASGDRSPNALAVGIARRSLCIFINDALLQALPARGIAMICAHELAHARRRHSLFYLAFLLAFLLTLDSLARSLGEAASWLTLFALIASFFLVTCGLLLPLISRRFEEEADLLGAESTGWADYLQTLRRLAELRPSRSPVSGWRHPAIDRRLGSLERLAASETSRHRLRRRCRYVRVAILTWLTLAAGLFAVGAVTELW